MKPLTLSTVLATLLLSGAAVAQTPSQTPSWLPPADSARCPSKWGAGDERGAANHMKAQTVLNAVKLIKTGEVIELSHPLNAQMPLAAGRGYDMQVTRTAVSNLANKRHGNEELMIAEMVQIGPQFDDFANHTHDNVRYNCFNPPDIEPRIGVTKLA